jgi:hypothetical protein
MRHPFAPLLALLLAACSHSQAASPAQGSTASAEQFLLESAASDFHTHGPKGPLRFRDVHLGQLTSPEGAKTDLLCGEFQRVQESGNSPWTQFVTIKTSGYEQYLGSNVAWCPRAALEEKDLSAVLQSRLDSLR